MSAFERLGDVAPQQLVDGFLARSIHGERATFAIVEIDPNSALPEHRHENEQLGMLLHGSMTFRIGDEERELVPGDTWRIPSHTPHSATAGPEGAIALDVFAPTRDDWKQLDAQDPRPPRWP